MCNLSMFFKISTAVLAYGGLLTAYHGIKRMRLLFDREVRRIRVVEWCLCIAYGSVCLVGLIGIFVTEKNLWACLKHFGASVICATVGFHVSYLMCFLEREMMDSLRTSRSMLSMRETAIREKAVNRMRFNFGFFVFLSGFGAAILLHVGIRIISDKSDQNPSDTYKDEQYSITVDFGYYLNILTDAFFLYYAWTSFKSHRITSTKRESGIGSKSKNSSDKKHVRDNMSGLVSSKLRSIKSGKGLRDGMSGSV
ncbi:hypothetical protein AAMO2058_000507400 [Amorphochlora amoebiformis]